ncbi:MAG: ComF family protein [Dysgonamonadaceae bacterium]|nr:ComF family protein [Dysgonamonadaceae bacterium]
METINSALRRHYLNAYNWGKFFITLTKSFLSLFYPKLCVICGEPLVEGEDFFCLHCFLNLPKTNYHLTKDNLAFDRFLGKVPIEKAASYLYYNKAGMGQKLVAEIKYRGNIYLGKWLGQYVAKDFQKSGFFEGIDYLIPVPLHPQKYKKRGFNQSEIIAQGITDVSHIPLETRNLYRTKANTSQTRKGVYERWLNTTGNFKIKDKQLFAGKHVLLIDDVLTTGSTLEACIICLLETPGIKISLLTIAIA